MNEPKKERYLIKAVMARSKWSKPMNGVYACKITIVLDRPISKRPVSVKISMWKDYNTKSNATVTPDSPTLMRAKIVGYRHFYLPVTITPGNDNDLRIKVELDASKHNQDEAFSNVIHFDPNATDSCKP
jgi:hypothetical protein